MEKSRDATAQPRKIIAELMLEVTIEIVLGILELLL
jgi:hypothetical protein